MPYRDPFRDIDFDFDDAVRRLRASRRPGPPAGDVDFDIDSAVRDLRAGRLKAPPNPAGPDEPDDDRSWGDTAIATAARVVPSIAGGVAGAALGNVPGAAIGGAAGGAFGEWLAEEYEKARGLRKEVDPRSVAVEAALGAVPLGKTASWGRAALKGAGMGVTGSTAHSVVERGELPSLEEAALSAGFGGVFGGGIHAAADRFGRFLSGRRAPAADLPAGTPGGPQGPVDFPDARTSQTYQDTLAMRTADQDAARAMAVARARGMVDPQTGEVTRPQGSGFLDYEDWDAEFRSEQRRPSVSPESGTRMFEPPPPDAPLGQLQPRPLTGLQRYLQEDAAIQADVRERGHVFPPGPRQPDRFDLATVPPVEASVPRSILEAEVPPIPPWEEVDPRRALPAEAAMQALIPSRYLRPGSQAARRRENEALAEFLRVNLTRPDVPPSPPSGPAPEAPPRPPTMTVPRIEGYHKLGGRLLPIYEVSGDDVTLDPTTYQFKESDVRGRTGALKGVEQWDPTAGSSKPIILHKRADGRLMVADGHQRVNKWQELKAAGADLPPLRAIVLDEAEGFDVAQVRRISSLQNIREGSGEPTDIAKLLRTGQLSQQEAATMPRGSVAGPKLAQGESLATLSDQAFQAVINKEVPSQWGAMVARSRATPEQQLSVIRALAKADIGNDVEADAFVKALLSDDFEQVTMRDMFGESTQAVSLAENIAKIVGKVNARLAREKRAFGKVVKEASVLKGAGNVLAEEENVARAGKAQSALEQFELLKDQKGTHTREAMKALAARMVRGEATLNQAVDEILPALQRDAQGEPFTLRAPTEAQPTAAAAAVEEPTGPTRAELEAEGQGSMFGEEPPAPLDFDAAKNKQVHRQLTEGMGRLTDDEIRYLDSFDEFGKPLSRADRGDESGFVRTQLGGRLAGGVTGGVLGGTAGVATADEEATPQERLGRFLAGAAAGGIAGAAGGGRVARALTRETGEAIERRAGTAEPRPIAPLRALPEDASVADMQRMAVQRAADNFGAVSFPVEEVQQKAVQRMADLLDQRGQTAARGFVPDVEPTTSNIPATLRQLRFDDPALRQLHVGYVMGDREAREQLVDAVRRDPNIAARFQDQIRQAFGDEFTVYRGATSEPNRPSAFTLDRNIAEGFAQTEAEATGKPGRVFSFKATPEAVLFPGEYTQSELVIDPTLLRTRTGEAGFVSPRLGASLGGGVVGATAGGATGAATADEDATPEERLARFFAGAATGAAAGAGGAATLAKFLSRGAPRTAIEAARTRGVSQEEITDTLKGITREQQLKGLPAIGGRARAKDTVVEFTGERPVPPTQPMPKEQRETWLRIEKFPQALQQPLKELGDSIGELQLEQQRRGRQSLERRDALAEQLRVNASKVLKPGTTLNSEETRAYTNALAAVVHESQEAKARYDATGNYEDGHRAVQLDAARAALLSSVVGARSEAGRSLAAWRALVNVMPAEVRLASEFMSRGRLRASMDEVSERLGQIPKDPTEAVKYLAQMEKQGWGESAFNYYMANILSGIKTHERNVLGNAFNTISRFAIKGTTAAPVDLVKSMLTGKPREVFAGESAQEAAGAYAAAGSAIRDAFDTMRHGFSPKALEEGLAGITPLYIPKKEFVGGAANPFNLVGRTLEAGDRFFVTLNRGAELYGQSYAIARKEGLARQLKGRALQDYVASRSVDLRANPGEELQRSTLKAAEKSAYREDPGPLANQIIALKKHVPAMGFVVPFVRTVSNIFRQGIEHTPLTAIQHVGGAFQKSDIYSENARDAAIAQGKMLLGSAAALPIIYGAASGRISGMGPKEPAERAALYEQGWRPNSIKLPIPDAVATKLGATKSADGEYWINYSLFQPLSTPLAIFSNAVEAYQEISKRGTKQSRQQGYEELAMQTVFRAANTAMNQTYLQGISGLVEALQSPERGAMPFIQQVIRGFSPLSGLSSNIAQAVDPVIREAETLGEDWMRITPGLSESLRPRLDRFGRPIERSGSAARRGFMVPEIEPVKDDVISRELQRLDITLGVPNARIDLTDPRTGRPTRQLTADEAHELRQLRGQSAHAELARVILTPGYEQMPDFQKRERIEDAIIRAGRRTSRLTREGYRRNRPDLIQLLRNQAQKTLESRGR